MTRVLKFAGIVLLTLGAATCRPYSSSEEDGPDQPIAFYHNVHAGQNQIPCMYCHTSADRSVDAGIPSVALCVGCHVPGSAVQPPENAQLAFPAATRDSAWHREATKLVDYWRRQEAIPWVRIHDLPDHAKFPHYVHVNVGLQCQTCHGPVQEMEKVYQFSSLRMGWCVDCHRGEMPISEAEEAAVRKNSSYVRRVAALAASGSDVRAEERAFPNQRASTDCTVCHY